MHPMPPRDSYSVRHGLSYSVLDPQEVGAGHTETPVNSRRTLLREATTRHLISRGCRPTKRRADP
jgi:hypothetical protein